MSMGLWMYFWDVPDWLPTPPEILNIVLDTARFTLLLDDNALFNQLLISANAAKFSETVADTAAFNELLQELRKARYTQLKPDTGKI